MRDFFLDLHSIFWPFLSHTCNLGEKYIIFFYFFIKNLDFFCTYVTFHFCKSKYFFRQNYFVYFCEFETIVQFWCPAKFVAWWSTETRSFRRSLGTDFEKRRSLCHGALEISTLLSKKGFFCILHDCCAQWNGFLTKCS